MKKQTKKSNKRVRKDKRILRNIIVLAIPIIVLIVGLSLLFGFDKNQEVKIQIEYSTEPVITGDEGEISEEIATVEEIDGGGQFKDTIEAGFDENNSELYYELGSIEEVNVSSPEAFKKSTLGRCIIASNYYGAQCVSLARAFWWAYAGYDVSTCGTGLAKGMMNCSDENAKDKFKVIRNTDEIQEGTWIVLDGDRTGHICMAMGKVNNGYVTCLGENQGGVPCEYGVGGAGTNIINISVRNFIGGYTPITYIIPEKAPEPEVLPPDTGKM